MTRLIDDPHPAAPENPLNHIPRYLRKLVAQWKRWKPIMRR
jgi:hypothetical protein